MKPSRTNRSLTSLIAASLVAGIALAATVFDPDWINTSTNGIQPVGFVGAPSASGYVLKDSSQQVYVIDYSSVDWSGNLHSREISPTGSLSNSDQWGNGAGYIITSQNFDTDRKIVTFNGASGIPFRWASLSSEQTTALESENILNFIRGDRSNEAPNGAKYRTRDVVLGDIIHSSPLHWDDGTNRTVFVGANDGMLHAINADSDVSNGGGKERFAFVPSQLISKLPLLKSTSYTHRYFVDGQLAARKYSDKSILVGGLGGGGKGLFALDISAVPTDEVDAASKVLWEISSSSAGYANLGHTYGSPLLTTMPDGTSVLVMSNGYNNTGSGRATLFLINPRTGAKIAEYDTGSGTAESPNGLSSPTAVDTNNDGKSDYIYAGDIDGNLWRFDLSSTTSAPVKLFTTSPVQSITMAPAIYNHPLGGRMVIFGTGRIFETADVSDTQTHYAYGIWDRPDSHSKNDSLLQQTLTEANYTGATPTARVRTASSNVANWTAGAGNHMGWKTALPMAGERLVGDGAYATDSVFIFMSTNPGANSKGTPPGENWWLQINALTGGSNADLRFDLNGDGKFTDQDKVNAQIPVGRHMGGGVRSQLTAFSTASYDIYLANYDNNGNPTGSTESTTTVQGVGDGHFDVDLYYGAGVTCVGKNCESQKHFHQYDDKFEVTGVNFLNASSTTLNLGNGIPSLTTNFKVIASNQYLSPSAKLHIDGNPAYEYNEDKGYIDLKGYTTDETLNLADLQTYRRDPNTAWDGTKNSAKYIGSLAVNFPVDALSAKDWWGNGDVRAGLHPTSTGCVKKAEGDKDGNMYQPIIPPTNGVDGPGAKGYNGSTSPATATGVRHNGALVIQIIKDNTPDSALELSVTGRPEYGWRVKSDSIGTYVLAEYTFFWHHPNKKCYGDAGWTKKPAADTSSTEPTAKQAGSTDPKVGDLGGGVPSDSSITVTNADGSKTTTKITSVLNTDGTYTITTTVTTTTSGGETTSSTSNSNEVAIGGVVGASGVVGAGVTTPLGRFGRINWRELRR